jgi:DHA1 family multidrug resistance protein-like MFS transporter
MGVLFFVREDFEPVAAPAGQGAAAGGERPGLRHRLWTRLAPVLGSGALLSVIGVRLLMRLGARLTGPVLPLFIQSILPPDARVASTAGVISGVSAGAGAVGALGLGRLGDRTGYRPVMIACAMSAGVSYFLQFFVSGPDMLLVLQAVSGLAMGGILSTVSAALARLSPEGQEGIVYGVSSSIVSLANAVGPMAGSALAAWVGLRLPFLVAASIYGLAGAAAARLIPRRPS